MVKTILFLGKYDEHLLELEKEVLNIYKIRQKINFEGNIPPDVVKYSNDNYNIWIILGDVKPTVLLRQLISKATIIIFYYNNDEVQNPLDFLNDGWGPIYESTKAKNSKDHTKYLIGYPDTSNQNLNEDIFGKDINIQKKEDFIRDLKKKIEEEEEIEEEEIKEEKEEIKEEKEEIKEEKEEIEEEEEVEDEEESKKVVKIEDIEAEIKKNTEGKSETYKDQHSINYELYESHKKAIITKSKDANGEVFIPTYISYKNEKYEIIKIGEEAFANSKIEILSFSMDSAVLIIGNAAFENSSLKKLFIPKSLQKLNNLWCKGADMLNEIEVDSKNNFFSIKDDFLIYEDNKSKSKEILFSPREISGEYSVPEGITRIGNYSFSNRKRITSVKSSSSTLDLISSYSFYKCDNLESLAFDQNNRLSLGEFCFSDTKKLSAINIRSKNVKIQENCFNGCPSLTTINIESKEKTALCPQSFTNCNKIQSIIFNNISELSIGEECFGGSENLSLISFNNINKINLLGQTFKNCKNLENISIKKVNKPFFGNECLNGSNLKSISFNEINKITLSEQTFKNCKNLEHINLTKVNELILEKNCFSISNLKSIVFAEINTITLSEQMFKNCKNLESITVSKINELIIRKECFKNLTNLKSIGFITDSITLGENIFLGCTSLTYINIQSKNGKITINSDTFKNSLLKNVTIDVPNIILRSYCFQKLLSLESFEMTCSEIEIGHQCFNDCSSLKTFSLSCKKNITITSMYFGNNSIEKLILETKEELKINKESLNKLKKLKEVIISGKFIIVDDSNFKDCESLTTFTIKDTGSVQIGKNQFKNCKNLEKIHISSTFDIEPGKGHKIDFKNFDGASNLKEIYLSSSNIIISDNCFKNCAICKSLSKITFDNADKISLGKESFIKFSNLEKIDISANKLEIDDECFKELNVENVIFQSENIAIGNKCFQKCKKISKFAIIGAQTVIIGESAFVGCENLHKVSIDAASSLVIFGNCFNGDNNLESIDLLGNEIIVGTKAFFNCTSIQQLQIENSKKVDLGDNAFDGCIGLETINITSDTEFKAGKSCFNNSTKLDTVQIKSQQVIIDQSCFNNCSSMTLFAIPRAEHTFLLAKAFENCNILKTVDIVSTNLLKADVFCFYKTYKLDTVKFDSKYIVIDKNCFEKCTSLKKIKCPSSETIRCFTTSFNNSSHENYLTMKEGTDVKSISNEVK